MHQQQQSHQSDLAQESEPLHAQEHAEEAAAESHADQEAASRLSSQQIAEQFGGDMRPADVTSDDDKASSFSLSTLNPKQALYEARLALPGRKSGVLEDAQDISNQDVVLEQLAHRGAYNALDNTKLPAWGYREQGAVQDPESGFRVVLYMPTQEALEGKTQRAQTIRAIHGGTPPPVLAFRGTSEGRGVSDDVNRHGIGTYQFDSNEHRIEGLLESAGGKVLVTGHSLGGALAQLAACRYPASVSRVVTFQSPGINESEARKLRDHNQQAKPEDRVTSTHHRAEGDVVHAAGEALTDGVVYEFESVGVGWAMDHTNFPLARLNAARGGLVEGVTVKGGKQAKDLLVDIDKSDSISEKDDWKARGAEWFRTTLGGLLRDKDMEPYVTMWSKVKEMCESGGFSTDYVLGVVASSDLTDKQKVKMRDKVLEKYG